MQIHMPKPLQTSMQIKTGPDQADFFFFLRIL